jgi:hypothetical protein
MKKIFIPVIDLVSKKSITEEILKEKKFTLVEKFKNNEFFKFLVDKAQLTKEGKIEIYAEDIDIKISNLSEILNLIKIIEKEISGFCDGSYLEIEDETGKIEKWEKSQFSWEIEVFEDDKDEWEDGIESWEDEWN